MASWTQNFTFLALFLRIRNITDKTSIFSINLHTFHEGKILKQLNIREVSVRISVHPLGVIVVVEGGVLEGADSLMALEAEVLGLTG